MVICSDLRLKKCIVWVGNRMTPGYVNIHTVDAEQRFFFQFSQFKNLLHVVVFPLVGGANHQP